MQRTVTDAPFAHAAQTLRFDRVGKIARGHCANRICVPGDFAHPTFADLFGADAGVGDDRGPFAVLGREEGGEVLGRADAGLDAELREPRLQVG